MAAEISSYTSVFRVTTNTGGVNRVTKRNRAAVSCSACRMRKLKCNREQPCSACVKKGEPISCDFTSPAGTSSRERGAGRNEAQIRLQRLEEMVHSLIDSGAVVPAPEETSPPTSVDEANALQSQTTDKSSLNSITSARNGYLTHDGKKTTYLGPTHWSTILESIHDIRNYLESDDTTSSDSILQPAFGGHSDIIFGVAENPSLTEILMGLPPRNIMDKLLAKSFTKKVMPIPFIHSGKFQRDYNSFLEKPASVSFLWISILFSALAHGAIREGATRNTADLSLEVYSPDRLLSKAAQCMVAGQYFKAEPLSVEALLLYSHCKYLQSRDSDSSIWIMYGLLTRLAQRMGYHRDPRHLSARVTPFEGEMRRRVWYFVDSFDLLYSFQQGMPATIHEEECDTEGPSNLFDDDFDEDSEYLPPSRPYTDETPMLYFCFKSRIGKIFRQVFRHVLSTELPPYEETTKLENSLQALYHEVPPSLRYRSIQAAKFSDSSHIILQRMMLRTAYLKITCILHRPYLTHENNNPRFKFSRDTCVDAALQMLEIQAEFYQEAQPGGRLHEDRWKLSSMTLHDLILASMIICLDLSVSPPNSKELWHRKVAALKSCYSICRSERSHSNDAAHATKVLEIMMGKVAARKQQHCMDLEAENWAGFEDVLPLTAMIQPVVPVTSDIQPTGLDVTQMSISDHNEHPAVDQRYLFEFTDYNPLNDMLDDIETLNWKVMDQYVFDRN